MTYECVKTVQVLDPISRGLTWIIAAGERVTEAEANEGHEMHPGRTFRTKDSKTIFIARHTMGNFKKLD